MKIKFINAKVITNNDDFNVIENGVVVVDNNIICYVGNNYDDVVDETIDCNGAIIMPGLLNANVCIRNAFIDTSNISTEYDLENLIKNYNVDSDKLYTDSVSCYNKMLSTGTTCVVDISSDPIITAKAMLKSGIRGVVGLEYTNKDIVTKNIEELLKLETILPMIFVKNIYDMTEQDFADCLEICKTYNLVFSACVSQTLYEVGECVNEYNMTPVELLESYGMFDIPCVLIGATHIDKEEMQILNSYNVSVVNTATFDLMMGYGIAPICAFIKRDINVCIGSGSVNVLFDMFKEMGNFVAIQKGSMNNFNAIKTNTAFMCATTNTSRAFKINNVSVLQSGEFADIIIVQGSNRTCNLVDDIVYFGGDVKLTMVNGKILYRNNI